MFSKESYVKNVFAIVNRETMMFCNIVIKIFIL